MRIGFPDAKLQQLFNDYDLLEGRFGADIAAKIATRMAVLTAANHLGLVPRQPPIRLRPIDGSSTEFTVDLTRPHKLRFAARNSGRVAVDLADINHIEEIEVLGVD